MRSSNFPIKPDNSVHSKINTMERERGREGEREREREGGRGRTQWIRVTVSFGGKGRVM